MTKFGGVGRHLLALEATNPNKVVNWAKLLMAVEWIYLVAVTLRKLSILSMYLGLFTTKSYRRIVYVLAVTLIMTFLVGGLTGSLKVTRHQKIGLTLTFLTGSVGLIASIFRFATFFRNDAITDGTFSFVELMSWTIIEPGIYLVAACLPALRPLAQRIFKDSLLTRLSTKWMPKYGDRCYERSTVNIKLEGHRSVRSEVHRPQPCFHRLTDGKESIGKSSADERSLVDNYWSARDNVSQFARNDCGSDLKAQHIRVENDIVVTTSDSLA
ncbi:hypothetical protein HO133_005808 [Letharia lupina]|uniref:Rhodopsin domain-containing protein n=1 Tax=Letharia lupina TaxID=560253 RepID=A0A8H6C7V0_9LECA|nr:uncharacterized protein HO133_005808 [Letharia lupina]KAF6218459.1 hypothetical protein HO133_005808 [Letharia lupina]